MLSLFSAIHIEYCQNLPVVVGATFQEYLWAWAPLSTTGHRTFPPGTVAKQGPLWTNIQWWSPNWPVHHPPLHYSPVHHSPCTIHLHTASPIHHFPPPVHHPMTYSSRHQALNQFFMGAYITEGVCFPNFMLLGARLGVVLGAASI